MDLRAQHLSETCSDPIEYLRQLRQTTEPIGGSTVYDEDGELVEYDVAIEAVEKANKAFIEKAYEYLSYHLDTSKIDVNYKFEFIEEFRKYMKGE